MAKLDLRSINTEKLIYLQENHYVGKNGRDYNDHMQEIDNLIWERKEKEFISKIEDKNKLISKAQKAFKFKLKALKAYHKAFGDSKHLRKQILACIADYKQFELSV